MMKLHIGNVAVKGFFTPRGKSETRPCDRRVGTTRHKCDDAKETASAVESEVVSPNIDVTQWSINVYFAFETLGTIWDGRLKKKRC